MKKEMKMNMKELTLEELQYNLLIRKAELEAKGLLKNNKADTLQKGFQALMPSESRGFTDSEGKPLYGKYRGYSLITECEVIFEINKYWWEGYEHAKESSSSGWYDDSRILKTIPELPKNIIWNDHIYLYPIVNCVRIEENDL